MTPRAASALAAVLALLPALSGCAAPPPPPPPRPPVVLLTDFALRDDAVGLMRGVIASLAPGAPILDLCHEVPPFDVRSAARLLAEAPGVYPPGSVFVCVVDPGVGTDRRAIVARLRDGSFLVAPDNGLIEEAVARHGPAEVRSATDPGWFRAELSATFHGRDVFAPLGGHLAAGRDWAGVGPVLSDWVHLPPPPEPRREGDALLGEVVAIDEPFGNVWTNVTAARLEQLGLAPGASVRVTLGTVELTAPWVATFGDVPEGAPLIYVNSRGTIALALNMGDLARRHGVRPGAAVRLARP